jgi:hypothetical protein
VVQLRLGIMGCAAGVLTAFDEFRPGAPSRATAVQQARVAGRAVISLLPGGAGVSVFKPATAYGFTPRLERALIFSLANGRTGAAPGFNSVTVE